MLGMRYLGTLAQTVALVDELGLLIRMLSNSLP